MTHDLILAGGGLANGLIAWRLRQLRPELDILCIEEQSTLGGNHTWSFHDGDLSAAQHRWLEPLVVKRWPGYQVHFPQQSRTLHSGYASITSERFAEIITPALGESLLLNRRIAALSPTQVSLDGGERLAARVVIDGRGMRASPSMILGQQAFLGQLLRLERPHGLATPVIMDARVAQGDGYRFVYLLPFCADTVLVEDTHYVDQQRLTPGQLREHIGLYVRQRGWSVAECLREEHGVLPITLAGDFEAFWDEAGGHLPSGLRAGLCHCTTGYSLPEAVRLADWLAARPLGDAQTLASDLRQYARRQWQAQGFYRLLNRMLFLAGRPQDRWQVMQRFYALPETLIERFYAGHSTWRDRARILTGKPPVPVGEAVKAALRHSPRHFETPT
ncbi:Lycopene beta-cyclase [Pseudomonas fluorescens]|uniref:lycopene beta-cyclase CrtY n=1 Tax=Pseudomonas fluorescens TaxID=294 RepID=UPI00125231E3|nr:lycopene beta-cyclase CrtY [Pseudomonas fluorescens]CAG8863327.1 Lycopene beta-cyclase [Pseudomonas fluorescens]